MNATLPAVARTESRFVSPTRLCPRPALWSSTDHQSTEVEVSDLAYGLVRALQPMVALETGTGFGQTARRIAEALAENGHGVLYTIESDHLAWEMAVTALRPWACVEPVLGSSLKVKLPFMRQPAGEAVLDTLASIEFAWFDSGPVATRVAEFFRYQPFMRPGSIVCFHDTAVGHVSETDGRSLRDAIEAELVGIVRLVHLPTPRGVTIAEVL